MCRTGPCLHLKQGPDIDDLPLRQMVWPRPEKEGGPIKTGYTGDYDDEKGGDEDVAEKA